MTAHNQPGRPAAHRLIVILIPLLIHMRQARHLPCRVQFDLLRVSVAQQQVGSFDVRVDVLVLVDELQHAHLGGHIKHPVNDLSSHLIST